MGQEPENTPQGGQEPTPAHADPKPGDSKPEPRVFDEAYVAEIRREAAKYRTEAQEAKGKLTEREEAEQSDLEKAQSKATKAEQAKAEAESKLLRFEVAAEKKVPAEAVDLLVGTTREELEAKADKLLSLAKKPDDTDTEPDFNGGAREPAKDPKTPEEQHNDLLLGLFGRPT
jgi:hypothetical protein